MGSTDPEEGAGPRATSRGWSCEGSQRHTALAQHMHGDGVFLSVLYPSLVHDSQSLIGSYKYFKRDLTDCIIYYKIFNKCLKIRITGSTDFLWAQRMSEASLLFSPAP